MAEVHFIDGTALTPTSFGEVNSDYKNWQPIEVTGLTYGTNGFHLDFATSGTLGNDANGSNNWTANNLASTDQMLDSPTNNFCTWNPIADYAGSTFSEGNTKVATLSGSTDRVNAGNFGMTTGKWYFEVYYATGVPEGAIGVIKNWENHQNSNFWIGGISDAYVYYRDGKKRNNSNVVYGDAFTTGDIISIELDMDNGTIDFHKNGVSQGEAFTGLSGTFFPVVGEGGSSVETFILNAGQDSSFAGNNTTTAGPYTDSGSVGDFFYEPPTGFLALCTNNLPEPAVKPQENFGIKLYPGSESTQSITGLGFQPDLCWFKSRSGAYDHNIVDSVRGVSPILYPNSTGTEYASTDGLTSFDTDGFTLGTEMGSISNGGYTYVAWNWKAGGAASSNTNGSITSSVSANQDAGFSIVSWTGTGANATVGHGLSKAPEMTIYKARTNDDNWAVYHKKTTATARMLLNSTAATGTDSVFWQNTEPTNTLITLGSNHSTNHTGTMITYNFHSVEGYSKVGSYTGNGSADGTFVYCGFRPAYVMIKNASGVANWTIVDIKRDTYNVMKTRLFPSNSSAESTGADNIDGLSNGFKVRNASDGGVNTSGSTYIYLSFAEYPAKYTTAR
jgi:hypothetical protein